MLQSIANILTLMTIVNLLFTISKTSRDRDAALKIGQGVGQKIAQGVGQKGFNCAGGYRDDISPYVGKTEKQCAEQWFSEGCPFDVFHKEEDFDVRIKFVNHSPYKLEMTLGDMSLVRQDSDTRKVIQPGQEAEIRWIQVGPGWVPVPDKIGIMVTFKPEGRSTHVVMCGIQFIQCNTDKGKKGDERNHFFAKTKMQVERAYIQRLEWHPLFTDMHTFRAPNCFIEDDEYRKLEVVGPTNSYCGPLISVNARYEKEARKANFHGFVFIFSKGCGAESGDAAMARRLAQKHHDTYGGGGHTSSGLSPEQRTDLYSALSKIHREQK